MINEGFEAQCTLRSEHFDPKTHELNRFGLQTVAGIMQNMPSTYKKVYVNQDHDPTISKARKQSVESVVGTFYSQIAPDAQVAFTTKLPPSIRGIKAEGINKLFTEGAPMPIIPISSGSDSVQSAVNN